MFCQKLPQPAMSQFKPFPRLELDCVITLKDAEALAVGNLQSHWKLPHKIECRSRGKKCIGGNQRVL